MLDQLATTLKRNALAYHAGQTMFCPGCQTILDARRAVELDFSKDGQLVASKITCATCYDTRIVPGLQTTKLPQGVTLEVNDGRVLFARPKRERKAKANTAEVHHYEPATAYPAKNAPCKVCDKTARHANHRTWAAPKAAATPKSKLDIERVMEAAQEGDGSGFCLKCGEEQGGCEPDARKRMCDACGEQEVYGAEEVLLMTVA